MATDFGSSWVVITDALGAEKGLEFLKAEVTDISTLSDELLAGWSEAVLYQGFDVIRTICLLKKRYDDYTREIAGTVAKTASFNYLDKTGAQKEFSYSNKEKILKDVALILFLFANRGASWEKIKNKSRDEFVIVMGFFQEKYDINVEVRSAGVSLKADKIVVSRIAACFPLKVVEYFHAGLAKELLPMSKLGISNLSKDLLSNHMVGVVPHDLTEDGHALLFKVFLTCVYNDRVLHMKDRKYTSIEELLSYFTASYNSVAVPNTARLSACKKMGLISQTGVVEQSIVAHTDQIINKLQTTLCYQFATF